MSIDQFRRSSPKRAPKRKPTPTAEEVLTQAIGFAAGMEAFTSCGEQRAYAAMRRYLTNQLKKIPG